MKKLLIPQPTLCLDNLEEDEYLFVGFFYEGVKKYVKRSGFNSEGQSTFLIRDLSSLIHIPFQTLEFNFTSLQEILRKEGTTVYQFDTNKNLILWLLDEPVDPRSISQVSTEERKYSGASDGEDYKYVGALQIENFEKSVVRRDASLDVDGIYFFMNSEKLALGEVLYEDNGITLERLYEYANSGEYSFYTFESAKELLQWVSQ